MGWGRANRAAIFLDPKSFIEHTRTARMVAVIRFFNTKETLRVIGFRRRSSLVLPVLWIRALEYIRLRCQGRRTTLGIPVIFSFESVFPAHGACIVPLNIVWVRETRQVGARSTAFGWGMTYLHRSRWLQPGLIELPESVKYWLREIRGYTNCL